jgi:hypothetical protein
MDSKQIRTFQTADECVKHFIKQGFNIKIIAKAFSREHTLVIGRYSINIAPIKSMKKKERAEYVKKLMPNVFNEKTWLDRFEVEFGKWLKS